MARKKRITIWFGDEAPKIGSGIRRVYLKTLGHKWAHLQYWTGGKKSYAINTKIRRNVYDRLIHLTEKQLAKEK